MSGDPNAERVLMMMGSGCETAEERCLTLPRGEKVGLLKVRLYRPFSVSHFIGLPRFDESNRGSGSHQRAGKRRRTTVPGCGDCNRRNCAIQRASRVVGGRYGLSSKEFTPAMVKAVFDELKKPEPKNHFQSASKTTYFTSIPFDQSFNTEPDDQVRAMFWGLGADGTVSANKNSIKIIGEETPNYAQGYFVYDSKKSGAMTVSHCAWTASNQEHLSDPERELRRRAPVAFFSQYNVLDAAVDGATLLLNSPYEAEVWDHLPSRFRKQSSQGIKVYAIDADRVAEKASWAIASTRSCRHVLRAQRRAATR